VRLCFGIKGIALAVVTTLACLQRKKIKSVLKVKFYGTLYGVRKIAEHGELSFTATFASARFR